MRERRYLTFDMENPRHREALSEFDAQPDKLRSEFVIGCILQAKQEQRMEGIIRQTITDALSGIRFSATDSLPAKETEPTEDIAELPDALLSAMDGI